MILYTKYKLYHTILSNVLPFFGEEVSSGVLVELCLFGDTVHTLLLQHLRHTHLPHLETTSYIAVCVCVCVCVHACIRVYGVCVCACMHTCVWCVCVCVCVEVCGGVRVCMRERARLMWTPPNFLGTLLWIHSTRCDDNVYKVQTVSYNAL